MPEKYYRAARFGGEIEQFDVIKVTAKMLTYQYQTSMGIHERKEHKESEHHFWTQDWDKAKQFLVDKAKARVALAESRMKHELEKQTSILNIQKSGE